MGRSCRRSASSPRPSAPRAPRFAPPWTSSRSSASSPGGSAAGTFVNFRAQGDTEDIAELTSPLELIEVRLGIEPNMVRLAVLNATARDIERIAAAIERMEASSGDSEGFTLWDEEFHQLIAEATRNPLMVWVYRQINAVRTHSQWNAMKDKVLTPERIAEYNAQHAALYEAIRTRDIEAAVAIVTNHLHYARRQLIGVNSVDKNNREARRSDHGKCGVRWPVRVHRIGKKLSSIASSCIRLYRL